AHQLHGGPVVASLLGIEVQPSELGQLLRELGVALPRELAVFGGHLRAGAAASAVRQQGQVAACGDAQAVVIDAERTELDEVVSAPARAELRPRLVLAPAG